MSISRRSALQLGISIATGVSSVSSAHGQDKARVARDHVGITAKSVLLVYLPGAPSQIDTFDMKPDAPDEIRGAFSPTSTSVPGTFICEHLPKLAARTHLYSIVRSMALKTIAGAHEHATPLMLGGIDERPPGTTLVNTRNDWPSYAAGLEHLSPRSDDLPNGVHLPHFISNGAMGYAGQNGGFLGASCDPLQVESDPNSSTFRVENIQRTAGLSNTRFGVRRELLQQFNQNRGQLNRVAVKAGYASQQQRAFNILNSGRLAKAFDLSLEDAKTRDNYGRHTWGQSLLLARRLIDAGVPFVQANLGTAGIWDTHQDNFNALKTRLLPPFDIAFSALLDDLHGSGAIDKTLVIVTSEFGRTPTIGGFVNTPMFSPTGRDHWGSCFHTLFAGGGVDPGQVLGESDEHAAYCKTPPFFPSDIGATIYTALGIDPRSEIHDQLGRPYRLNSGKVMSALF